MIGGPRRLVLMALAVAAAGIAGSILLGAAPAAALLALLAGVAAHALLPDDAFTEADTPLSRTATLERHEPLPEIFDLLHAVRDPMLVVRDGRILAANRAATALLGRHALGADVRLVIRHPRAAELLAGPATPLESGTIRTEIVGLGDADRPWSMTVNRLPDGSRIVHLEDLSEARATERIRADFVANASHELRTPLATLLGFLETLEEESVAGDPETRRRFLEIMRGEADRMRGLVDDLMTLSRIESGRFSAPTETIDLREVVEEVRSELGTMAAEHDADLIVEDDTADARVLADRPEITQMLRNLVANAFLHGRTGTDVVIQLQGTDDFLEIAVVDQGEGISPEHLPRLTERFYRVDPGRSRSVGGTGLGLAIVKHVVQRHRGSLDISSRIGTGTAVRVRLPRPEHGAGPAGP